MKTETLIRLLLTSAVALSASAAHAERTMAPLQVQDITNSDRDDPNTGKETDRVSDGDGTWAYRNDRDDAQSSDGEPGCYEITQDSDYDFIRRLECGKALGNDDFGASYGLYAGLYAWDRGADDKVRVDGGFDTQVTIFGTDKTIFAVDSFVESTQSGVSYGRIDMIVLDSVVEGASREFGANINYDWALPRDLFSVRQSIPLAGGIVSVTVQAGATGSVGASFSGGIATAVSGTFTPNLDVTAYASAGVGIAGGLAAAGVDINLLILGVSLPIELAVDVIPLNGQDREWRLGASLVLESLSGWLEVWATAFFNLIEYRKVVASWSGFSKTFKLVDLDGALSL